MTNHLLNNMVETGKELLPYTIKVFIKIALSPKYYLKIFLNDLKAYFGKCPGGTQILFVAGYPKCGTTWVENFISNIPGYNPRILYGDRDILRHHNLPVDAFIKFPAYGYSAIKTHILPSADNVEILINEGIEKIVIMYRDPRDIAVSQYYHVLNDNPWKTSDLFYADYSKMTKENALSHSIEMVLVDYSPWVMGWIDQAKTNDKLDCMVVKYEELRNTPIETFRSILDFFEIELSEKLFNNIIMESNKNQNISLLNIIFKSYNPGLKSTKRLGGSGGWRDEMSIKQKNFIKDMIGQLLIELEYEDDLNW